MAKPEWGVKRACQSCGARFYDLRRTPIICPKCKSVFDAEALQRPKRPRSLGGLDKAAAVVVAPEPELEAEPAEAVDEEKEAVAEKEDEQEEQAEGVIEDTSELGEDKDDVADVIDKVDDEDDR